jgi:hypothetical protein
VHGSATQQTSLLAVTLKEGTRYLMHRLENEYVQTQDGEGYFLERFEVFTAVTKKNAV